MTTPVPVRLPINGGVQLTMRLLDNGQPAAVVLGAVLKSGFTTDNATVKAWLDQAWAAFKPLMPPAVTCIGGTGRLTDGSNTVYEVAAPAAAAGTSTQPAGLAAGAILLKWSTATGGRSGKGRTFLPSLPSTWVNTDGRTYTGSLQTGAATAVTTYLGSAIFQTTLTPAVLSFRKGAAYPITGGALASTVGIQRRRMRA